MMMRLSDAGGDQQRGLLKTGDIAKGISEGQQQHHQHQQQQPYNQT